MQRQVRATEFADDFARDVGIGDHRRGHDFAARAGRFAIDLRLPHAVDLQDHLLDFARVHFLACGVNQITATTGERDLAVGVDLREIVGDESTVERLERSRIDQRAECDGAASHGEAMCSANKIDGDAIER